jgi:hypothetical protein
MARFNVTAPDGSIIPVDAPDGATEQDAIAFAASVYKPSAPVNKPPRTGNKSVDQIPGSSVQAPASTAAPDRPESGFLGKLMAPLETAVTLGTGVISAPIVEGAKIYGALTSGKFGTQEGIKAGEATGRKVQQFFQPQVSPESEAQTQAIGNALASTGLQGVPLNVLGDLQRGLVPATRAATDAVRAPVAARAARIQESNVAQSYANAPMIDAAQAARRVGGAVPPAISNPTKANVIKGKLVGPELEQKFAKDNEIAVTERVRKDLGVKPNEKLIPEIDDTGKLNTNSPITRALGEASKPYDVIRQMEALTTPKESIDALTALKRAAPIGGDTKTAAINGLIDDALTKLQLTTSGAFSGVGGGPVAVGRSGAAVLDDIRSLRRDAQATYRAQKINPDPLATAKADTQIAIANILEDVIDANAPTPKVLNDLRAARTRMAQIYEHERAINYGQQKIDPQVYAKLYEERKGGMTGLNADIAQAASMFPDYFTLTPAEVKGLPRITRGGVGGAIGGALGVPLGPAGVVAGTAAGIGIGSAAGALAARRMATPAYQAANAMPRDYRPVPSGLRPVEPNTPVNALAPFDYSQQSFTPPNFVMRAEQYGPRVVPGAPEAPPPNTLGYNPNVPSTAEVQMNRLRAEDVMDRNFVAQRTAAQEAQQAAAEAAARKPAGRGVELMFDTAGNLVEAPTAGAGGVIGTPSALASAVAKIAGQMQAETTTKFSTRKTTGGKIVKTEDQFSNVFPGEAIISRTGPKFKTTGKTTIGESTREPSMFNLTAEEMIAWNKTKANLAEIMPGMKTLDDKAVAGRLMDLEWIKQAVIKGNEKARMLDDIIARSENARLRQDAKVKREVLQSDLELLEEQFRKARPVKTGGQGPKTRAFQRNMLRPDDGDIQNALVK